MARSGAEEKIAWQTVPNVVRHSVEERLGAKVVRGSRVWGGYGPTPTFRLLLADGSRVFFKGSYAGSTEFVRDALLREEHVYRELGVLIGPWSPRYFGALRLDGWHVLLLEDVGPASIPPWTHTLVRDVAHAYAAFHRASLGLELPDWLPRFRDTASRATWSRVAAESDDLREVAALAHEREGEALTWLHAALPTLSDAAEAVAALPGPDALLHLDTRSDNLRFRNGRLALFDWPWAEVGRPEIDVVAFAQSITVEGGPPPEQFVACYEERLPLRPDALDASVAWLAAFFADLAWRPNVSGLPRLRPFQRAQLRVVLPWAARRLGLPTPSWLNAVS